MKIERDGNFATMSGDDWAVCTFDGCEDIFEGLFDGCEEYEYDQEEEEEDDLVHYALDLGMRAMEYQELIDEMEGDA